MTSSAVTAAPTVPATPRSDRSRWWVAVALAVLLAIGLGLRLVNLTDPAFQFQPARQYFGALISRNYALGNGGAHPTLTQAVASAARPPLIEPPILEALTAAVWWVTGSQAVWVGQLWSCLFWLAGGLVLYGLGRRLGGRVAGLVAATVFVLDPFAINASRTFQPDPMMVVGVAAAAWALVVDDERRTRRSFLVAAAAGAFALLAKQVGAFLVLPVVFILPWAGGGWRAALSRRTFGLAGAIVAPVVAYSVYGLWINPFLGGQESGRALPHLLVTAGFWHSWWALATTTVGTGTLLVALASLLVTRGRARALLVALFVGYVLYGLTFTYFYETFAYYHLPVLVPVSLGVGLVVGWAADRVRASRPDVGLVDLGVLALVVLAVALSWLYGGVPFTVPAVSAAAKTDLVTDGQVIGGIVHHDDRSIILAQGDGLPLRFYALVAGSEWPDAADRRFLGLQGRQVAGAQAMLTQLSRQLGGAHYFIVTDMDALSAQPALRQLLDQRYPLVAATASYRIYDLRHPRSG